MRRWGVVRPSGKAQDRAARRRRQRQERAPSYRGRVRNFVRRTLRRRSRTRRAPKNRKRDLQKKGGTKVFLEKSAIDTKMILKISAIDTIDAKVILKIRAPKDRDRILQDNLNKKKNIKKDKEKGAAALPQPGLPARAGRGFPEPQLQRPRPRPPPAVSDRRCARRYGPCTCSQAPTARAAWRPACAPRPRPWMRRR